MSLLAPARKLLAVPFVYRTFGRLTGGVAGRVRFARDHIRARPGQRLLDIGCGPADILPHLPGVDYTGFDASEDYIATAKRVHGDKGQFYAKRVSEETLAGSDKFDVVLAIGLIHHLDDAEAEHLFRLAHGALAPGGRFVTLDCVYTDTQSRAARYIISRDRGEHVRDEKGYLDLAKRVFTKVTPSVYSDLLRIPYTHLILECER
jgi:SAM-dependent methyltransferase